MHGQHMLLNQLTEKIGIPAITSGPSAMKATPNYPFLIYLFDIGFLFHVKTVNEVFDLYF